MKRFNAGREFGDLVVVGYSHTAKGRSIYEFHCKCQATVFRSSGHVTRGHARCDNCANRRRREGSITHGRTGTPEYVAYIRAKMRCENPKSTQYKWYGERGIEFRFESFEDFYAELGDRPSLKHSVDRINNDGHYEKGNLRWATQSIQVRNSRTSKHLMVNGDKRFIPDLTIETGIKESTIRYRIKAGMCLNCVLSTALNIHCCHNN